MLPEQNPKPLGVVLEKDSEWESCDDFEERTSKSLEFLKCTDSILNSKVGRILLKTEGAGSFVR